jgi:peptidylprolyl isomerase
LQANPNTALSGGTIFCPNLYSKKENIMQKVEDGQYVSVHYTGTLDSGEVFDSSQGRRPLEFKVGAGQLISGFEQAVQGMSLNEKKEFTLSPEDAYGQRDENQIHEFPASEVPAGMDIEVGQTISLSTPQGQSIPARVTAMDDEKLTFDLNHPLAGQSLTFAIEVVNISDTPTQATEGCDGECGSGCSC